MIDLIKSRHSYRGSFQPQPVPRADLIKILEAGLAAPSGCNKQTTSLIAVDDSQVLAQIWDVMTAPISHTAPALIAVLAQKIVSYRDKTYYVQDYSAAIENMLLAIKALGYESCWVEGQVTEDPDMVRAINGILHIPADYHLVCLLPVGIATDEVKLVAKKPFEERAWFNGFMKKD